MCLYSVDPGMAAGDDRVPYVENAVLQACRGIPRLSHVELHGQGVCITSARCWLVSVW